ncbi:restriction endonuclease subunit S [Marinomonas fungiae]|uniref:restriction endonuclease subunit S n=1 Tax=Marinomonas fungiae TaxID=1137284 RepID=UPI003A8D91F2
MAEQHNLQQLITEHIDLWTGAVKDKSSSGRGGSSKRELYGIKKLRELILELAVRGKLVAQDPNDESASVLLERIAAEKDELVKQKKIKKPKKLPEISEEEKPFELPEGWDWCTLSHLGYFFGGKTPSKMNASFWDGDIPWVTPKDMKSTHIIDSIDKVTEEGVSSGLTLVTVNSLLCVTRSGILRRHFPVAINKIECTVNQDLKVLTFFDNSIADYVLLMMKGFEHHILQKLTKTGTTVESLVFDSFVKHPFILPPEPEQHRIVAKVDELMALCDQLEQQTESSLDALQTLVQTLLDTLLQSADAEELEQNWQRLSAHFDLLFTTEQSIDQLKQTILQLAVMGKLVPQDPNDEPASELLKRIAAEKEELVKQKKIKKQKPLPPISDDEKPFQLPKGWELERIGTFSVVGTGATPSRSNSAYWTPAIYNWVSSGETSQLFISDTNEKVSELALKETNVSIYPEGTLIVAMYGQGKTRGQVTELLKPAGTNQACAAIRLVEKSVSHKDYVKLFFLKSYNELREFAAGGAQPNLNVAKVANTIVPLPPISEQHRIVSKVDQLIALCDQLKAKLADSKTTQLNLTDALVAQAV